MRLLPSLHGSTQYLTWYDTLATHKTYHPVYTQLPMRQRMEAFVRSLQFSIVSALERVDGTPFRRDSWARTEGGGGLSCVLQEGKVFEKAGVNVSVVHGALSEASAREMRSRGKALGGGDGSGDEPLRFFATGVSMVLHPHNPMAPTVHLNYRYFEVMDGEGRPATWWFGGGMHMHCMNLCYHANR